MAFVTVAATALLLWKVAAVLLLVFSGLLGAVLLLYVARWLSRWTGGRVRIAVTVVLLVTISTGVALAWLAAPAVVAQTGQLREQLQSGFENVDAWLRQRSGDLPVDDLGDVIERMVQADTWSRIAGIFSTTLGVVSAAAISFMIAVFVAYDSDRYRTGVLRLIPPAQRRRAQEVLTAIYDAISRWLLAQLCSMAFLGLTTWLVLWLLGVPLALALAVLTGILTFVPYLGPLIALVPIVLIAFAEGPMLALYAALAFFVVQNIEGNLFMPFIYQKTNRLPPALTLATQILFGAMFGLPGFIVATPLAVVALVAAQRLYVEDTLGDDLSRPVETPRDRPGRSSDRNRRDTNN